MGVGSEEENIAGGGQEEEVLAGKHKGSQKVGDRNPEPTVGQVVVGEAVEEGVAVAALLVEEEPRGGAGPEVAPADEVLVGDDGRDGLAD